MRTALSIAGSDCSGGAGIQADLKTMTLNGVYAMSAITALTAQNTTGVTGILEVDPDFLKQQIDMIFTDIRPDAVKIGMVSNSKLIEAIAERLRFYRAERIVVDPVMVATSGSSLMETEAVFTLKKELLPLAAVATPNIPEAEVLSGMSIRGVEEMETAAKAIHEAYGCAVLLKGGHSINDANDLLFRMNGTHHWFMGKRVDKNLNERLLSILSTKENVNLMTLGFEEEGVASYQAIINPIEIAGERLGTVFSYRDAKPFDIEDIIVSEYGTTVVGLEMMRSVDEENAEEARKRQVVKSAFSTLSFSELEAIIHIFEELDGNEGILVASKIADRVGITRSVIVNALRKFESAGVIESRSSGMKGTYIKVLNDFIFEELEEIKAQRGK